MMTVVDDMKYDWAETTWKKGEDAGILPMSESSINLDDDPRKFIDQQPGPITHMTSGQTYMPGYHGVRNNMRMRHEP